MGAACRRQRIVKACAAHYHRRVARLRLQTFGGLQVHDAGGGPLVLAARKPAALFAYLALHPGKPQPRSKLGALLWSDSGDAAARASLRQALLVVRRATGLGDDELVAGPGETLAIAEGVVAADALELEAAIDDDAFDAQRVGSLVAAIDGEFLEGLATREAGYDDWLALRRAQLRERLVAAHQRLLDEHRLHGRADAAMASALRLLALDPLREDAHRLLMELYAGQHRWGAALRQFQLCRDVLARELGVRPQPQTVRVRDEVERLRAQAGAAPTNEPGAAHPGAEPRPGPGTELRAAVLLAAESAQAADEADPERAQAQAEAAARAVREGAAGFGGTVERRAGGATLVCFGAPFGHGDDAERAARCALRLVAQAPELRIGVATGPVLVEHAGRDGATSIAGGEVAGLAMRLMGLAGAGEVLLPGALWRRVQPVAEGAALAESALPPMLRKTGVHRLVGWRQAPVRRAARVGRRAELAQFGTLLDACLRDGTGSVLHLRGEPGIGKTRLADEFRQAAVARGCAVHAGTVLDFGSGVERDALRTLVLDLLGLGAAAIDDASVARGIAAAVANAWVRPEHEAALHLLVRRAPPPALRAIVDGMDPAGRLQAQRDALRHLVSGCAFRQPRLLVLEDLHWADADTLGHAAALAAVTASAPLLLVTTARDDGDPLDAAWRQAARPCALTILDIGPLRWVDASTLAAQLADAADPYTVGCVERAGGNPLFLEQLLQADRVAPSGLPATVQSVVQARLDRLAAPEREAVRVAAVLGQRYALAALDHLLGAEAAWDPRLARGLMRTDGREGVYDHALIRDGAYASLPRARRQELHARAARWYQGRDPVLRAEQLQAAEDPCAAAAWLEAARAEAAAHRHERAQAYAARGRGIAADAHTLFALACVEADALQDLGRSGEAHAAWQRALEAAGDDAARARAWLGIASALRLRDDLDGSTRALDAAAALAAAAGTDELRARIHGLRGNLLFPRGDLDGCRREHEAALELAQRAGCAELEAAALGGLGDAAYLRGHMLTAERRFSACVALARRHGLTRVEAANLPMGAWTCWFAGRCDEALAAVERGIAGARAIGHLRAEAIAHHIGCLARQAAGDAARARQHAEAALDLARRLQSPRFEAEALAFLGSLDADDGDRASALARLHEALALARSSGMAYMGPVFLGMLARVAAHDEDVRVACLTEADRLLDSNGLAHNHLLFRREAIEACRAVGDTAAMRRHAEQLQARTQGEALPWSNFVADRAVALAGAQDSLGSDGLRGRLLALIDAGRAIGLLGDVAALQAEHARLGGS